ncbi:VOC family protein [Methylopila henanensis]|uniref:VOC family protein n=1 Tax=Methylopila henanensis TaxID=873516 RepID=A0ABW4K2B9_9HYPH
MPLPLNLTLVTLGVADIARSTAFYEALGLKAARDSNANVTFFNTSGPVLSVYSRAALAADAQLPSEGDGFRGLSLAWNLASEADVDKAIVRIVAAGGKLIKAAEKTFWGGYSGYAADPDDHLWEIAHNPGFPFDDAGRLRAPE